MRFTLKGVPSAPGQKAQIYEEESAQLAFKAVTWLHRDGFREVIILDHSGSQISEFELIDMAQSESRDQK